MKRYIPVFCLLVMISGCSSTPAALRSTVNLRTFCNPEYGTFANAKVIPDVWTPSGNVYNENEITVIKNKDFGFPHVVSSVKGNGKYSMKLEVKASNIERIPHSEQYKNCKIQIGAKNGQGIEDLNRWRDQPIVSGDWTVVSVENEIYASEYGPIFRIGCQEANGELRIKNVCITHKLPEK